jgi:pumilio RNA-binding family
VQELAEDINGNHVI